MSSPAVHLPYRQKPLRPQPHRGLRAEVKTMPLSDQTQKPPERQRKQSIRGGDLRESFSLMETGSLTHGGSHGERESQPKTEIEERR